MNCGNGSIDEAGFKLEGKPTARKAVGLPWLTGNQPASERFLIPNPTNWEPETLIFALVRTNCRMKIALGCTDAAHLPRREMSIKRAEKMSRPRDPESTPEGRNHPCLCLKYLKRDTQRETLGTTRTSFSLRLHLFSRGSGLRIAEMNAQ